ncbi:MAG: DUF4126 domain-containing protein [Deltaproteobacteria bacterium]|nr:DUF4126 domain-containing protein [Deltaproteobacteria bacterium]
MDNNLSQIVQTLSLTMGVAWASGINLYAAVLMLGLLGATGHMTLPENLQILANPLIILAAGVMYLVEFFADKTPGVDSGWDALHTFIRIPAGAVLAAGAVGAMNPAVAIAAGIVGGGLTASVHATKAGSRVLINNSPEPFSNWVTSVAEDVIVLGGLFAALYHPWLFLGLLVLFILLMIWLLPKLWRGLRRLFGYLGRLCGRRGVPLSDKEGG